MAGAEPDGRSTAPLGSQLASLGRVYWIANTMEMIERLAYYGLRTVVPLYMVLSIADGGPEFSHIQKGWIFSVWAAIQSFLPVFTGGYADRYGYKLTIGVAIAVKIAGYLVMAWAVDIALALAGSAADGPGSAPVFYTFLLGASLLAAGTAIFKPGLQGVLAKQLSRDNDSLGWALFYQLVNVGGFLGPYLASVMRLMAWRYVFVACAIIVSFNYLLLFTFSEPPRAPSAAAEPGGPVGRETGFVRVFVASVCGIFEPRLGAFLVTFSGFWMMFHQLFDLLPNFISDWTDSSDVLRTVVAPVLAVFGAAAPAEWGGMVPAEQLTNVNAGMIMLLAFAVGFVTGRVRAMTTMIAGILVSAAGTLALLAGSSGWLVVGAVVVFSLGEMMASPTKLRYLASIAPDDKKGLYLGYANATSGIGWSIGSLIAGSLYEEHGDKVTLARHHLVSAIGWSEERASELPRNEVVPALAHQLQTTVDGVREVLWAAYHPQNVWVTFATVGLVSMVGLIALDQVMTRRPRGEPIYLIAIATAVSLLSYGAGWTLALVGPIAIYALLERFAPAALETLVGVRSAA